ncbi:MAG: 50S ribosomal protein L6 [Chloroflexi bacterium]|nr:50S ribosomal protein L6 [Chloroflexota bacterium]MCL5074956.1 50S ribosomal protein L6 [Chloroflexota bacterium]
MSRIGRMPIEISDGVQVHIDGNEVTVKGPKGELTRRFSPEIIIEIHDRQITVRRSSDDQMRRALHGLSRSLLANMVTGVAQGFQKALEIYGIGYRAQKQGDKLILQLGFSHPVEITPPDGIEITDLETFTPTSTNDWLSSRFVIRGIDKEKVGDLAAKIRAIRKSEPYKGKGIRYAGERVRRKAGKSAKATSKK